MHSTIVVSNLKHVICLFKFQVDLSVIAFVSIVTAKPIVLFSLLNFNLRVLEVHLQTGLITKMIYFCLEMTRYTPNQFTKSVFPTRFTYHFFKRSSQFHNLGVGIHIVQELLSAE